MRVTGAVRAALRPLLPVRAPLPKRYWRWTWLAMAVRLLIGIPFFLILIGPYMLARGFCLVLDWSGGILGNIPVRCYNRDLRNSGWKQPARRRPAVRISPEWGRR